MNKIDRAFTVPPRLEMEIDELLNRIAELENDKEYLRSDIKQLETKYFKLLDSLQPPPVQRVLPTLIVQEEKLIQEVVLFPTVPPFVEHTPRRARKATTVS